VSWPAGAARRASAGETIVQRFSNQRGHGVYRGTVSFHRGSGQRSITVGRFSERLP